MSHQQFPGFTWQEMSFIYSLVISKHYTLVDVTCLFLCNTRERFLFTHQQFQVKVTDGDNGGALKSWVEDRIELGTRKRHIPEINSHLQTQARRLAFLQVIYQGSLIKKWSRFEDKKYSRQGAFTSPQTNVPDLRQRVEDEKVLLKKPLNDDSLVCWAHGIVKAREERRQLHELYLFIFSCQISCTCVCFCESGCGGGRGRWVRCDMTLAQVCFPQPPQHL